MDYQDQVLTLNIYGIRKKYLVKAIISNGRYRVKLCFLINNSHYLKNQNLKTINYPNLFPNQFMHLLKIPKD